jgi:hypothetical protein
MSISAPGFRFSVIHPAAILSSAELQFHVGSRVWCLYSVDIPFGHQRIDPAGDRDMRS